MFSVKNEKNKKTLKLTLVDEHKHWYYDNLEKNNTHTNNLNIILIKS